jgi:hypothetical protein
MRGKMKHIEFYKNKKIVEKYDKGRIERINVKNLHLVLDKIKEIPLYCMYDYIYEIRRKKIMKNILYGNILDLGSGTSYFYRKLIDEGWIGNVTRADISNQMLNMGDLQLKQMLTNVNIIEKNENGIFYYINRMGQKNIDIISPNELINYNTLNYILNNKICLDEWNFKNYDVVTALSAPLCFYEEEIQKNKLKYLLENTNKYISFQTKNLYFYNMQNNLNNIKEINGVIKHIFDNKIIDSYMFLKSIDFRVKCEEKKFNIKHEVGDFIYYPISYEKLYEIIIGREWEIENITSFGFCSETFHELITKKYEEYKNIKDFYLILNGIDQYFCEELLLGENMHITAYKKNKIDINHHIYNNNNTYRNNYHVIL